MCQKNRGGCSNQQYGGSGRHASKQQLTAGEKVEKTRETPSTAEDAINTNTTTKSMAKWVINISSRPLSTVQERLLAQGPNFAVVLREPPIVECITEVEKVCQKLEQGVADKLRGRIKTTLKKAKTPRQNITKEEHKAIGELKRDNNRLVLSADKGVALVVMDKEDYVQKARELLDQPTYRNISNDPTTKYTNKLVNLLKSIKSEGEMEEALYKKLYPTGAGSPKFYGLPKIHKERNPLRPIVSSIGAASYEVAKELARILKPLVGKSIYHIHNTQDFIQQIKDIKLQKDQCMVSFDVKALFTSVPIKPAINTIKKLLEEDPELQKRTTLSVTNIIRLLEYCLTSTYFIFQGRFYEQQEGAAMGSPISPIIANLYMEKFEQLAINTAPPSLSGEDLWMTPSPSWSHHTRPVSWNT